jgi:hypothetical protein
MTVKHTIETINERLILKNIKLLSEYKNVDEKTKLLCLICSNIWETSLKSIFYKTGCPYCSHCKKLNNTVIDDRLKDRKIIRIDDYINSRTKIKFKCLVDGHEWYAKPSNVLNIKQGCPLCKISKSENNVLSLIKEHVNYDTLFLHHKIIINEKPIYPDFMIIKNNKKIIIEYNGEQHYKPVRFNNMDLKKAIKKFNKQKLRDNDLRDYCKYNNITLLEIPYLWKSEKIINELLLL